MSGEGEGAVARAKMATLEMHADARRLLSERDKDTEELVAALRELERHIGYGQLVSASTIIADLLAKHGGAA